MLGSLALLWLLLPSAPVVAGDSAPEAVKLAERLMTALGGEEAWGATHFLRFRFADFRTHYWDKWSGRHRLELTSREGDAWVVLENVVSREGRAFKNGAEVSGEELAQALERAHAAWINDTYWLLMPYKLRDPGVTLAWEGKEEIDGIAYDKVRLSFDHVGLTPGDRYWVYLNPETGLVDRWAYILESYEEGRPATAWTWGGWQRYGGILLASERKQVGGDRELPLSEIAVFDSLPDAVFDSPEPVP